MQATDRTLGPLARAIVFAFVALGGAAASAQPLSMSGPQYEAAKERIHGSYQSAKENCDRLAGNARDICHAEAKGKQQVQEAELDYRRTGSAADATKVDQLRADAAYDVAKEMCDDRAGHEKEVCLQEAKAAQVRARADAKAAAATATSRREATSEKRDADYDLALKRCDGYSGRTKSDCVDAAKARYGKN